MAMLQFRYLVFLPFTSSDNLWLGLGLGSVLIVDFTSTFRTPAKFISHG